MEDDSFTGMGISAGGGMCNVCLAYLSVPLVSFSINKGGDYIDDATASVPGETYDCDSSGLRTHHEKYLERNTE